MSTSFSSPHDLSFRADNARREWRLLRWSAILALALACAWLLAFNLVDPDLWGHIRYGQDWLTTGEMPRTATHTFTAVDHPWINHENLAELALAFLYNAWGVTGLLTAKCLLGMAILLAMVWTAGRRGVEPLVSWILMLLVALNLQSFFPLRPQLLSFACCAAMLLLLDRAFCDWQPTRKINNRWLWCLPLVFLLWANSHGGFVAGLAIVGAYLGGRIVELLLTQDKVTWSKIAQLALVGLACLAATLANPYGWELHRWLAVSLMEPRPEITEWCAPQANDPTFWPWIALLVVIGLSLVGTAKRRDGVEIAILLLVVWQSALHLRHIAFVALLCGFWLPVHLESTLCRWLPRNLFSLNCPPWLRRGAIAALLTAIGWQSFALDSRLKYFTVDRGQFPIDAAQFMADRELSGKLVASFNWSQYALAALAPRVTVGFDGRYDTCYPLKVVDMHFDFLLGGAGVKRNRNAQSGLIDGTKVLQFEQPDLVLIDRHYEHPVAIMRAESEQPNPQWVLLYRDRVAELWGRSAKYADPASVAFIPTNHRVQDASLREGHIPWPALPLPPPTRHLAAETIPTSTTEANL